jgi:excinuclease UvrABC ATPase subunit
VIDAATNCVACGGSGFVETTVKLEVGARREKRQCSTCGGSGNKTQQRIELRTFKAATETCFIYFEDRRHDIWEHSRDVVIDLEGAAKTFFAKWQPASQSTYLRERCEKERRQAEERARQEELRQQELKQRRIREALCLTCGRALGFMDKMSGRQIHKDCS